MGKGRMAEVSGKQTRKKKEGSIFGRLLAGYIVFAIVSVILLYVCTFGVLFYIGGGRLESLVPYELVDEEGNVRDIHSFERFGGWIEKLNDSFQVTEVYGEKKDGIREYSMKELTEYLTADNLVETESSASEYRGFLKAVSQEGETSYYLMKVSRNALQIGYTYQVGSNTRSDRIAAAAFLLFGLLFLINCLAMSAYLSRRIKKPLEMLMDGMEKVRAGGSGIRLDFEAPKEFAGIRDTFNMMIGQLDAQKREKRQNEEKKNRMLLEISHDIKTPVATIKSSANVLEEGLVRPEEVPRYYHLIDQKSERVDTLVNELFLLLKMEDAGYELQAERVDLCELVRQVCAGYYEEITEQGLDFQIQIPERPICVKADKKEFSRVVENLLGNAAKYNRTGHMAAVEVCRAGGRARICVRDDGEAIDGELRPLLFDPFVRGDPARCSDGGTGLGLAIAAKIVEKHGGELRYDRQNGENVFTVSLEFLCV